MLLLKWYWNDVSLWCHCLVLFADTLCYCRELLHSSQLDVSYFAGGVISHLLADDSTRCMLSTTDAQELRAELVSAVVSLHFAWGVAEAKCILVTAICVSVCPSPIFPHYCTDPDISCGNGRACALIVHYWAYLQSVHGFRCYDDIVPNVNLSSSRQHLSYGDCLED